MNQYFEVLCSDSVNRMMQYVDYAYGERGRVAKHYEAIFPGAVRLTPLVMIDVNGNQIEEFREQPIYIKYHQPQSKHVLVSAKNIMHAKQLKPLSDLNLVTIKNLSTDDTLTQTSDALAHLRLEIALLENRLKSTVKPIGIGTPHAGSRDAIHPLCYQCKQPVSDYWQHYEEGGYWRCK